MKPIPPSPWYCVQRGQRVDAIRVTRRCLDCEVELILEDEWERELLLGSLPAPNDEHISENERPSEIHRERTPDFKGDLRQRSPQHEMESDRGIRIVKSPVSLV
jgi:hypothetical protein